MNKIKLTVAAVLTLGLLSGAAFTNAAPVAVQPTLSIERQIERAQHLTQISVIQAFVHVTANADALGYVVSAVPGAPGDFLVSPDAARPIATHYGTTEHAMSVIANLMPYGANLAYSGLPVAKNTDKVAVINALAISFLPSAGFADLKQLEFQQFQEELTLADPVTVDPTPRKLRKS